MFTFLEPFVIDLSIRSKSVYFKLLSLNDGEFKQYFVVYTKSMLSYHHYTAIFTFSY